jgi:hypothetical protein
MNKLNTIQGHPVRETRQGPGSRFRLRGIDDIEALGLDYLEGRKGLSPLGFQGSPGKAAETGKQRNPDAFFNRPGGLPARLPVND